MSMKSFTVILFTLLRKGQWKTSHLNITQTLTNISVFLTHVPLLPCDTEPAELGTLSEPASHWL